MEQISFYLDEHIHRAVADGLRRRGVKVLTVQEARRSGLSDREQLSFALSEQRVMVTMDYTSRSLSVVKRSCRSCSLLGPRSLIFDWNSFHISRSCLLAPDSPLIPRALCTGSRDAKLLSFIARLLGVRPILDATSMISGLLW